MDITDFASLKDKVAECMGKVSLLHLTGSKRFSC